MRQRVRKQPELDSAAAIVWVCGAAFDVPPSGMRGVGRDMPSVNARRMAVLMLRALSPAPSFPSIAAYVRGDHRKHATVIDALRLASRQFLDGCRVSSASGRVAAFDVMAMEVVASLTKLNPLVDLQLRDIAALATREAGAAATPHDEGANDD